MKFFLQPRVTRCRFTPSPEWPCDSVEGTTRTFPVRYYYNRPSVETLAMEPLRLIRHGKALRLRAPEGTYSYYHPKYLFTGLGWDAQTGSLLLARRAIRSILILGLGGGTVARQCRALFPDALIVGVELNRRVIDLAYQPFALRSTDLKVVIMAGEKYLRKTNRRFDAILDDMWIPHHPDQRAVLTDPEWSKLVFSRITPGGIYAANLYSRSESRYQASGAVNRLASRFRTLREVRPSPGETTVIAGGRNLYTPRETRAKLRNLPPALAAALAHVSFRTIL